MPKLKKTEPLVKQVLVRRLRQRIMSGKLRPGDRVVENKWASEFGVAQASIREAINILVQDGFVAKADGRSARVTNLSEDDVLHLYELRGALEGLAARRAVELQADLTPLKDALTRMRTAARKSDAEALLDADLAFHLALVAASGNRYVVEQAERILIPFFAFVRIRVVAGEKGTAAWNRDLDVHRRIIDLINDGDGSVVERFMQHAMSRFAATAYENWEKTGA
jgi:DNA-binding GntR family transcriptional regulator